WRQSAHLDIVFIVGITYVTRGAFSLQALIGAGETSFVLSSDDGETYVSFARSLLSGGDLHFIAGETPYAPGYTFFVALLLVLTGGNFLLLVLLHSMLAAVTGVLLYLVLRHMAGRLAALTGGMLLALNVGLLQVQGTMTAEALALPFIMLFIWALTRYEGSPRSQWILGAGVALAIAIYSRNMVLIFLPATVGWILLRQQPRLLRRTYFASLLILVVVLPLALTNFALTGTARLTGQDAALAWGLSTEPWQALAPSNEPLLEMGIDPFREPATSLAAIWADPAPVTAFVARSAPRRAITMLFPPEFGLFDPLRILNPGIVANAFGPLVDSVLIAMLLLGFVMARRDKSSSAGTLLILLIVAYLLLFSILFTPYHPPRYHTLIAPFMITFQALGIAMLSKRLITAR
ncbi:MAG: glycosyltransferase family 39 protein, partial [Actinobacteria bacterium]|nr:glycosyltransferase family 39 protein [Actinomycetota bacterium]